MEFFLKTAIQNRVAKSSLHCGVLDRELVHDSFIIQEGEGLCNCRIDFSKASAAISARRNERRRLFTGDQKPNFEMLCDHERELTYAPRASPVNAKL